MGGGEERGEEFRKNRCAKLASGKGEKGRGGGGVS